MPIPNVPVSGSYARPYTDPTTGKVLTAGSVVGFGLYPDQPVSTGVSAVHIVPNAMSPAYWNLDWFMPWDSCGIENWGGVKLEPVNLGTQDLFDYSVPDILVPNVYATNQEKDLDCYEYNMETASTRFSIVGSLPPTITLGGQTPFTTQYGMPQMYVYDEAGNLVATENATSVTSDGTQATFPLPSNLASNG